MTVKDAVAFFPDSLSYGGLDMAPCKIYMNLQNKNKIQIPHLILNMHSSFKERLSSKKNMERQTGKATKKK